jgi:ATP-dependent protease Clp ATPase subunit
MDENIGEFTRKKRIYREAGIDLEIDEDAVEAIVDLIEKEDAGARSVRNIMNQFADSQYFFDLKMGGYDRMIIHSGMLAGEGPSFGRGGEVALDGKSHRHSKKK